MSKFIAELFEVVSQTYGDVAKALAGKTNLPKPQVPTVEYLLEDRRQTSAKAFYEVGANEVPDLRWRDKGFTRFSLLGMETLEATFPSLITSPYPVNNTVRVEWARHKGDAPRPLVVILHGLFMPDYAGMDQLPFWFHRHGMDGVIIDLPYHMTRVPAHVSGGDMAMIPKVDWMLSVILQCILDIRCLGLWFKREGIAAPMGFFGISMGAYLGLMLAAVAKEFDFGIGLVAVPDILDGFMRFEQMETDITAYERRMGFPHPMKTDPRIHKLMSPIHQKPVMDPTKLFLANGEFDKLVPPEHIVSLADDWGLTEAHIYPAGHISTITANPGMYRQIDRFLAARAAEGQA